MAYDPHSAQTANNDLFHMMMRGADYLGDKMIGHFENFMSFLTGSSSTPETSPGLGGGFSSSADAAFSSSQVSLCATHHVKPESEPSLSQERAAELLCGLNLKVSAHHMTDIAGVTGDNGVSPIGLTNLSAARENVLC